MSYSKRQLDNAVASMAIECGRYVEFFRIEYGTHLGRDGMYADAMRVILDALHALAIGNAIETHINDLINDARKEGLL